MKPKTTKGVNRYEEMKARAEAMDRAVYKAKHDELDRLFFERFAGTPIK